MNEGAMNKAGNVVEAARPEPTPEDYKGWGEEANRRREKLKQNREKFYADWGGVFTRAVRPIKERSYFRHWDTQVGIRSMSLTGDVAIQAKVQPETLSEPQKIALDICQQQEKMEDQITTCLDELLVVVQELDKGAFQAIADKWHQKVEAGEISPDKADWKIREEKIETMKIAKAELLAKFPAVETMVKQIMDLEDRKNEEERTDQPIKDSIVEAEKKRESAERQALYGDKDPRPHPLEAVMKLVAEGQEGLERIFDGRGVDERLRFAQNLLRNYYLMGPNRFLARLADDSFRKKNGDYLFPENWE